MLLFGLGELTWLVENQTKITFPPNQPPNQTQVSCMNVNATVGEGGREAGNVHPAGWVCFYLSPFSVRHPVPLWVFYLVGVSFTFC